jgi:hypothetical protein
MVADLVRARVEPAAAATIAVQLAAEASRLRVEVDDKRAALAAGDAVAAAGEVTLVEHKHSLDVVLQGAAAAPAGAPKFFKLTHAHHQKLRQLYARHAAAAAGLPQPGAAGAGGAVAAGAPAADAVAPVPALGTEEKRRRKKVRQKAVKRAKKEALVAAGGFEAALFRLLARYHSLGGSGFQYALNELAFAVLHRTMGVDFECFASPPGPTAGSMFCSWEP